MGVRVESGSDTEDFSVEYNSISIIVSPRITIRKSIEIRLLEVCRLFWMDKAWEAFSGDPRELLG